MKVNLVFPPYISPSCVPIGIASLKSYLEENLDDARVKTIDLSLDFSNQVVEGGIKGICTVCTLHTGIREPPFQGKLSLEFVRRFRAAKQFIKNRQWFHDEKQFVLRVQPLYLFIRKYSYCFALVLKQYLEGRIRDERVIFTFIHDDVARALEGNPDVVGFSAVVDSQIHFSLAMAKMVKERYHIPIILGGPAFFHLDLQELMEAFDFIDFIIVKEGEEAILKLIKALQGKIDFHAVPNLVWRKNGTVIFNDENIMNDLNTLPTPDFSDLHLDDYYFPEPIVPISSSRGCPWNLCKFCQLNIQYGERYRQRSIEKVMEDIKVMLTKYKVKNFLFTDSEMSATRLTRISHALLKAGLNIHYGCYARPTPDLNKKVFKMAHAGGCRFLQLGVESLSERYLAFVNKGTTRSSILAAFRNAKEVGISILCYMLAGIPSQTREELLIDLRKIAILQKKYRIFSVIYGLYTLGKHQPFYVDREKQGIQLAERRMIYSLGVTAVHTNDSLPYRYNNRSAYDVLGDCESPNIDSLMMAIVQLSKWSQEFGINEKHLAFIYTINDFLFETQLLYAKEQSSRSIKGVFSKFLPLRRF